MAIEEAVRVGINPPNSKLVVDYAQTRAHIDEIYAAGIDELHVCDHVSFHGGIGFDALINAAALLAMHPHMRVSTAVYLLPLRHPVMVARQISDISRIAPGRLSLGVGIGGEEPGEYHACGIDLATRGRRMDESLDVLQMLLSGELVGYHGSFFQLDDVQVIPGVEVEVPIIIGGRSNRALQRVGLYGDGWVGLWNSPDRFAAATELVDKVAANVGRGDRVWQHAMFIWCGLGANRDETQAALAAEMNGLYDLPFKAFERYCPSGNARQIADFLLPYVEAGCRQFHLAAVGTNPHERIEIAAEVRQLLNA